MKEYKDLLLAYIIAAGTLAAGSLLNMVFVIHKDAPWWVIGCGIIATTIWTYFTVSSIIKLRNL